MVKVLLKCPEHTPTLYPKSCAFLQTKGLQRGPAPPSPAWRHTKDEKPVTGVREPVAGCPAGVYAPPTLCWVTTV